MSNVDILTLQLKMRNAESNEVLYSFL